MGWSRILSEWVGPKGTVVRTDIDDEMLAGARSFVEAQALGNVTRVKDDLFSSQLQAGSFDLVHSRFQIAPLGRADEQITLYKQLLKPNGWMVLEDPDMASWRVNPDAPAVRGLIDLIGEGFQAAGGNFNAGRDLPLLFRRLGAEPHLDAHVVAARMTSNPSRQEYLPQYVIGSTSRGARGGADLGLSQAPDVTTGGSLGIWFKLRSYR